MERLLAKTDVQRPQVVEYCVVCGDKASGKMPSYLVEKTHLPKHSHGTNLSFKGRFGEAKNRRNYFGILQESKKQTNLTRCLYCNSDIVNFP